MNPAEAPFTIENLTELEHQYAFVVHKAGKRGYTEQWLIYRMASELKHYKLQDALTRTETDWQGKVKKRKG